MPGTRKHDLTPFGERVVHYVKLAGFRSLNAAVRRAGLEPVTVNRWMNGKATPRPDLVDKLAATLGIASTDLTREPLDEAGASPEEQSILKRVLPPNPTQRETSAALKAIRAARENGHPPSPTKDSGAKASDAARAKRLGLKKIDD